MPLDLALAYAWANLADSTGNEMAAAFRDDLSEKMTREQIAEGQQLARELLRKLEASRRKGK
jgi:hypothetical protein